MQEFGLAKDKLLQRNSLEYILEFIYNPKKETLFNTNLQIVKH